MKVLEYLGARVAGILFLCWLCESAAGGCSRYGHACWGGHGKRSSLAAVAPDQPLDPVELIPVRDQEADESADAFTYTSGGGGYLAEIASQDAEETGQNVSGGERFEVGRSATKRINDLLPRVPDLQESNEIGNAIQSVRRTNGNRRTASENEDDVQVFIIPNNAVSQSQKLPSLHFYKILGRTPRKHP